MLTVTGTRRSPQAALAPRQRFTLALAGVALAVHFATWIASLQFTTVAVSTLLVATSPIWTALYDAATRRRALTRPSIVAFAGGGAGLLLVLGFDRAAAPQPGHVLAGAALALTGAFAFAAYLLLVRTVRAQLDTMRIIGHTYTSGAIVLAAAAVLARQPLPAPTNSTAWGGIIAMALVSQLLGHTGMNAALRWFTPSAISFSTLLEPIFAAVIALVVFAEPLPPAAILGGFIVLVAVAIVAREERETIEPPT